jgi:hypothetical protein
MTTLYPLTAADRRDMDALRQLRAAVFQKREALGVDLPPPDDRAAFDTGFLQVLCVLATRYAIRIITDQPATQFEALEEQFSYLSETYREEIDQLRQIWFRAWCRWFNCYDHNEHHPALNYLQDQVFMKAWLGDNPRVDDLEPPGQW